MGWSVDYIEPFGDAFIKLVKILIVSLLLGSLISGIAGMNDMCKLGRVAVKAMGFYILTTALAIAVGILVANVLQPGAGMNLAFTTEEVTKSEFAGVLNTILSLIPDNPVASMVNANLLQLIVFSLFVGAAASSIGNEGLSFMTFMKSFTNVMYRVVEIVMLYAPVGVCALMATTVGTHGLGSILALGKMIITTYVTLFLFILVVYMPIDLFYVKIPAKTFWKCMREPSLIAFSTTSSMAALPANLIATQKMGVDESTASFLIPLGNTVNMAGTAMYVGIVSNFVAQAYGVSLTTSDQVMVVLLGVMLAVGAVGVPGYMIVIMSAIFSQIGLPISGVSLVSGVDSIISMARTVVNVFGDAVVAIGVAKSEGELNFDAEEIVVD